MRKIDTSNEEKAAHVLAAAAVLFAKTCGMVAENTARDRNGNSIAYGDEAFEHIVDGFYAEIEATPAAGNGGQS